VNALLQQRSDARQGLLMSLAHFAQVLLQVLDGRIAFSLVARRNDEDKGFGLGTRLEEFVNQSGTNA
jgi:hypothetical protein